MTDAEFDAKNARRLELIEKLHSGFTEEERMRPFADHPGWEEECERREQEALTPAEHAELATLQEEIGAEVDRRYPKLKLPDLDAIEARLRGRD